MARGPSNSPSRRSPAKKTPAKTKRGTAPARGAQRKTKAAKKATAPRRAAKSAGRKASKAAKAPKAARGATAKRTVKRTAKRATKAAAPASTPPAQTQGSEEKGGNETPSAIGGRMEVRNPNVPGYRNTVDARKYDAMKRVLLSVLPTQAPGLTQAEMFAAVEGKLPEDVFPGQEKLGWWVKCVQLDLEARGGLRRSASRPLRWHVV